ncbi:DUF895 domain membrane protein [Entophlyctis sp. JEL0112]|nr:DUF895 domain membrane protein [Entophlyctis sp. JEL0112]
MPSRTPPAAAANPDANRGDWHRIGDVVILSVGFVLVFMAFTVLQATVPAPSMLSKLNPAVFTEHGLDDIRPYRRIQSTRIALRVVRVLQSVCWFASYYPPTIVLVNASNSAAAIVERIGCRAALIGSSLTYSAYAGANVVALYNQDSQDIQVSILLPFAILTGLGASVLWAAQGVYVTRCAKPENVGKFTGVFFGIFWWASILGPLLIHLLLKANVEKILVFKILALVGSCGTLVFVYLGIFRPEPSNPFVAQVESTDAVPPETFKFLKTFKIMFTRSMFLLAPLFYMTSADLENKLLLQATFGTTLMITSFIIGGITDRFGSRPLMVLDFILHVGASCVLRFWGPFNNFSVLFPCAVVLAFSDSLLMNQIYKLLGTLFPNKTDTPSAFAAYKFHQSMVIGLTFVGSKSMLTDDGIPDMNKWLPIVIVVFGLAVIGVFLATASARRLSQESAVAVDETTPLLQDTTLLTETAEELLERKRKTNRLSDVFVLALAFFFIFSAFMVIQGLASSVLKKSVAFMTLASLYFSFSFGNLFMAAPIVERVGCRAGLFMASITYSLFNFATVVALESEDTDLQTIVLIPSALLNGVGASVLWASESVYITKCACKDTVGTYAGFFFAFVGCANLAGPLFSSFMLQLNVEKVQVFKILLAVGAVGPLLICYILWRPPPSNPFDASAPPASTPNTPAASTERQSFFKTFHTMISPTILMLAPVSYFGSCQMAFNGGSIPLFIDTGDANADLSMKLYLLACMGATSAISSAPVGRLTDRLGPRVMLALAVAVYSVAMAVFYCVGPLNNPFVLFPCVVLFAFCSTVVSNQNYKIMGVLYAGTASAFAAQRFHGSLGTAVAFMTSGLMLRDDGVPDLNKWSPLMLGMLYLGCIGAAVVTRDDRFRSLVAHVVS